MTAERVDVAVVGGGLAGLTAGLFSARCGRSTVVLVPVAPGGALLEIDAIEDYPGFPEGVAGYELGPIVQEQAESHGAAIRSEQLERLERAGRSWLLTTSESLYEAAAVVLATGSRPRSLGVAGEAALAGRGVSHCASCDGPLVRGRTAGVVGGGDSALQEALALAHHAGRVVVFHRGPELTAQGTYRRRVRDDPAIEVRLGTVVEAVLGEQAIRAVRTRDLAGGGTEEVELAGLFVYVGREPEPAVAGLLAELDDDGRLVTDATLATSVPGIFAAGEARSGFCGQAVAAAGDGAAAAMAAHRWLAARERGPVAAGVGEPA